MNSQKQDQVGGSVGGHAGTPWHVAEADGNLFVQGDIGYFVADCDNTFPDDLPECRANAAFIVRACNAHDALVKTLREARRAIGATMRQTTAMRPAHLQAIPSAISLNALHVRLLPCMTPFFLNLEWLRNG